MSNTPSLYIVDEQSPRSSRLSTVLGFIHEPHQQLTLQELQQRLSADEPAVVLLGALDSQLHATLLQNIRLLRFCY